MKFFENKHSGDLKKLMSDHSRTELLDDNCEIPKVYMKHTSFYTIHQNQSFAQQAYFHFHFRPSSLQEKSRLITS